VIKSKQLNDAGWKVIASKNKIKDNGLLKALEMLKKVDDEEEPDEAAKILAVVSKLALALRKDKTVARLDDVVKYLGDMIDAVATTERVVEKAKAAAEKAAKAKAAAEKKVAAKAKADEGEDDEEDDEDAASRELLTTKQLPLLRMVLKGQKLQTLVAKSGKNVVMMLSRKPIPPARRRMLSEHLGGGSAKYYPGVCSLEAGTVTFTLSAEVAGLTKLVKAALLQQTGLRVNKVKCRGDDGDDEDSD
jgi:hypothetical protein